MIHVTKSYLPNIDRYKFYIEKIYKNGWLTNNGELVQLLEKKLADFLGVENIVLVANGSIALQLAYKALELEGEVITTPFSFAATTGTLIWEGLKPIFCDIDSETFNINPNEIEKKITTKTSAIVPVHVFGNACEIDNITCIADKYKLKVVYDAAHAFDVNYKNKSILNFGDISTISFHATKLFHTIEGGAIITKDSETARKIRLLMNFGISGPDEIECFGTNAKMNEFEAAMGLCVLEEIHYIKEERKKITTKYKKELQNFVSFQRMNINSTENNAYFPILFKNEEMLIRVLQELKSQNINPRRYFYPSLNTIFESSEQMKISQDIASRILCLPIYPGLQENKIEEISNLILQTLGTLCV